MNESKTIVATVYTYQSDGWYDGTRRRYYLSGFNNKTEARKELSMLKKYVKRRMKYGEEFSPDPKGKPVGILEEMETYEYCGAGPSWSCKNIEINQEKFQEFKKEVLEEREYRKKVGY